MIKIKKISTSTYIQNYARRKANEHNELKIDEKGVEFISTVFWAIISDPREIERDKQERPYYWNINPITMFAESTKRESSKPVMSEVVLNQNYYK